MMQRLLRRVMGIINPEFKMPLDLKIAASFWLAKWNKNTSEHEKHLISWIDDLFYSAMKHDPDYSLELIEAIHEADPKQEYDEVFAAGPLDDLLVNHGTNVIDRIVSKAKEDSSFAHVLGGVWKNSMPDEIWDAVKGARSTEGWADARD